jgi:hypothetical protein
MAWADDFSSFIALSVSTNVTSPIADQYDLPFLTILASAQIETMELEEARFH